MSNIVDQERLGQGYFSIIEECKAIIVSKGVYRQEQLYVRDDVVYAKDGAKGFIRLAPNGVTSNLIHVG